MPTDSARFLSSINVLLIEDDPGDVVFLRTILTDIRDVACNLICADRLETGLAYQAEHACDIILLDLLLPDSKGFDTFARMHAEASDVPIVVLTGLDDETVALRAIQAGAQDYLCKGNLDGKILVHTIRYAIERHRLQMLVAQILRQDLQRKDAFLSHVSHELRSPLAAIYQFVTILLDGLAGDLNPEQHEYLEIAFKNVKQLHTMINDLLEVSRAETGKVTVELQRTALGPLVSDTFAAFHQRAIAKGVDLVTDLPGELPAVYADPDRVRQVLSNLIDNGIKFTPAQGTITVQARIDDHDPNFLCIAVRDTGCGIRPEETEKLFERLYQSPETSDASRKGLGLGLYICRELIIRHNGRIWVESQYGSGATFCFTLRIFSLPQLLAPILAASNLLSVVLVTVVLQPKMKRPLLPADDVALQKVQYILERCISPDRDILLPGRTRRQQTVIFFIAACATSDGAKVLSERITRQLADCEALHKAGFEAVVSWAKVDLPSRESNASFSQCIADMVESMEAMMDTAFFQERH